MRWTSVPVVVPEIVLALQSLLTVFLTESADFGETVNSGQFREVRISCNEVTIQSAGSGGRAGISKLNMNRIFWFTFNGGWLLIYPHPFHSLSILPTFSIFQQKQLIARKIQKTYVNYRMSRRRGSLNGSASFGFWFRSCRGRGYAGAAGAWSSAPDPRDRASWPMGNSVKFKYT